MFALQPARKKTGFVVTLKVDVVVVVIHVSKNDWGEKKGVTSF